MPLTCSNEHQHVAVSQPMPCTLCNPVSSWGAAVVCVRGSCGPTSREMVWPAACCRLAFAWPAAVQLALHSPCMLDALQQQLPALIGSRRACAESCRKFCQYEADFVQWRMHGALIGGRSSCLQLLASKHMCTASWAAQTCLGFGAPQAGPYGLINSCDGALLLMSA